MENNKFINASRLPPNKSLVWKAKYYEHNVQCSWIKVSEYKIVFHMKDTTTGELLALQSFQLDS